MGRPFLLHDARAVLLRVGSGGACRGVLENQETVVGCRAGSRFQTLPCSSLKTHLLQVAY